MDIESLVVAVVFLCWLFKNIVTKNGHRILASFINVDDFKVRGRIEFVNERVIQVNKLKTISAILRKNLPLEFEAVLLVLKIYLMN